MPAFDYAAAFDDKDSGTRDLALLGLAAFGADGHWDKVADRLAKTLARWDRARGEPSNVVLMVTCLARHAGSQPGRVETLADVAPSDSPASAVSLPDGLAMQRWIKDHLLFKPLTI